MAYNPLKDQSAGYISKQHHELLQTLTKAHKRTKRGELEWLIEQAEHYLDEEQKSYNRKGLGLEQEAGKPIGSILETTDDTQDGENQTWTKQI